MSHTPLKVGSIVYATEQGLGRMAKDFYDHGIVTHPIIFLHGSRTNHTEWYAPGTPTVPHTLRSLLKDEVDRLSREVDVWLFFETPFDWGLLPFLRRMGKPTSLMVMYECMPLRLPFVPTQILCPSLLDYEYYKDMSLPGGVYYVRVPTVPPGTPRVRERCRTYVHNAGHGGLKQRNGTDIVLDAIPLMQTPSDWIIRSQKPLNHPSLKRSNVSYIEGTVPHHQLYDEGDAFVFPEAFNGLSLPLQEALLSGMLVVASRRSVNETYLPRRPLVHAGSITEDRLAPHLNPFLRHTVQPKELARHLDYWYDRSITQYSEEGISRAFEFSWDSVGSVYRERLNRLKDLNNERL